MKHRHGVLGIKSWSDNGIGDAGLILQAEKNESLCRSRPLTRDDQARHQTLFSIAQAGESAGSPCALVPQFPAAVEHRMVIDAQSRSAIIGYQPLFRSHALQR